jgi:hypothetical protein
VKSGCNEGLPEENWEEADHIFLDNNNHSLKCSKSCAIYKFRNLLGQALREYHTQAQSYRCPSLPERYLLFTSSIVYRVERSDALNSFQGCYLFGRNPTNFISRMSNHEHAQEIKQLRTSNSPVTSVVHSLGHLARHNQHPDKEYASYYPEAKYSVPAIAFSIR